jgi:hypothetical protein
VQVLDEERRTEQPRAVVHPATGAQLAHPRVDDREPGAPLRPGGEVRVVVLPLQGVQLGPERLARVARVVQEHVGVEVAPGELAHERVAPGAAMPARPGLQFAR